MFDKDFFPTPAPVIAQMLSGLRLDGKRILEPSAGKGDILDFIRERAPWAKLHAIERHPELQSILRSKGYQVLDSDFLSYVPEQSFDLIVMNPPFSAGPAHLLKALEISRGAEIICLLNAASVDNDWSRQRKLLLGLIEQRGGRIERLGSCFVDAERSTQVEVVCVRIPAQKQQQTFQFHGDVSGEKIHRIEDIANNQVAPADVLDSLVHRYNKLKSLGHNVFQSLSDMRFYAEGLGLDPQRALLEALNMPRAGEHAYEHFIGSIKERAWAGVFSQTKLASMVTSKVREDLQESQKQHGAMAFTAENLRGLLESLLLNLGGIREQCIAQAFDLLTKYHKQNRVHIEGWKTNDAWMVKRKLIIPFAVESYGQARLRYACIRDLRDVEMALAFVAGVSFESIQNQTVSEIGSSPLDYGAWHDSYFFAFKLFKKGTVHLEFKDRNLCQKFNLEACQGKNWLPADYGRSHL